MIVLITGPAGSGKSTFSKYFAKKSSDIVHIELDDVMINTVFFKKNLTEHNNLGRKITQNMDIISKFYNIVLPNKKLMKVFFSIFHKNIDKMIAENKDKLLLLDSMFFPFMPKYYDIADHVVCVTADTPLRIDRMLERDMGNSYKSIKKREEILDEIFKDTSKFDIMLLSNNKEDFDNNLKNVADKLIKEYNNAHICEKDIK